MTRVAIDTIDVSDPATFREDTWRPLFAELRAREPINDHADGPFRFVTPYRDVKDEDQGQPAGVGDPEQDLAIESFVSSDPPKHGARPGRLGSNVIRGIAALPARTHPW